MDKETYNIGLRIRNLSNNRIPVITLLSRLLFLSKYGVMQTLNNRYIQDRVNDALCFIEEHEDECLKLL
jgi:type IV secretory pathway VirB9-like protein